MSHEPDDTEREDAKREEYERDPERFWKRRGIRFVKAPRDERGNVLPDEDDDRARSVR